MTKPLWLLDAPGTRWRQIDRRPPPPGWRRIVHEGRIVFFERDLSVSLTEYVTSTHRFVHVRLWRPRRRPNQRDVERVLASFLERFAETFELLKLEVQRPRWRHVLDVLQYLGPRRTRPRMDIATVQHADRLLGFAAESIASERCRLLVIAAGLVIARPALQGLDPNPVAEALDKLIVSRRTPHAATCLLKRLAARELPQVTTAPRPIHMRDALRQKTLLEALRLAQGTLDAAPRVAKLAASVLAWDRRPDAYLHRELGEEDAIQRELGAEVRQLFFLENHNLWHVDAVHQAWERMLAAERQVRASGQKGGSR
jgi:hypothetical protein